MVFSTYYFLKSPFDRVAYAEGFMGKTYPHFERSGM